MRADLKLCAAAAVLLCLAPVCAQTSGQKPGQTALAQGCEAFRSGDWNSAVLLLRKAAAYSENNTAETQYMLIASEMYAGQYRGASQDCDTFLSSYSDSTYAPFVQYQKGRALFYLGEYDKSVLLLSDFCHQYPENGMYASALFWIAESFYAACSYDEARALYERIVTEFSDDEKAPAAQYRIETIAQRTREEKLLYLLRQTGEEYLSAKEDYEKQLKLSGSTTTETLHQKVIDLQKRNAELETGMADLRRQVADLQSAAAEKAPAGEAAESSDDIAKLKAKAREAQELLDRKTQEGTKQ
jgi:TolA-binding protein